MLCLIPPNSLLQLTKTWKKQSKWRILKLQWHEDGITRNERSSNKNYLLEQNHQPVCTICNERVGMNIACCSKCDCKIHCKCSLLLSYQQYNFI